MRISPGAARRKERRRSSKSQEVWMSSPIRRRDFLIAAGASGTAYLAAPLEQALGRQQTPGPDPDFHVYLAFGQSNMEGFPGIEAQDKTGVNKRFQMLAALDFASLGRKKGEWY